MLKEIAKILSTIMLLLALFPAWSADYAGSGVEPTPLEGRIYTDVTENITPDPDKHMNLSVADEGTDIYYPAESGYRYGPSLMINADGSIDAWYASPGAMGQWDWIAYSHSPDGGQTWTDEKIVLQATGDSMDFYSVCDPGAVYFNGYYYLGYTSTIYAAGVCNNVFVARSANPDGPFEKWNGSGWGGAPQPIVYYDGDAAGFGAGEPSFIVLKNTLYMYVAWNDTGVKTKLYTADSTEENWPAALTDHGVVLTDGLRSDSVDVKYVEDYGKFIAVSTANRFSENSSVIVYESDDGSHFTLVNNLKTNISACCHNAGISARQNGHINLKEPLYIAYAYGPQWGIWPTRLQRVTLTLQDEIDLSDAQNSPIMRTVTQGEAHTALTGIATDSMQHYRKNVSSDAFPITLYTADADRSMTAVSLLADVTYSNYDTNVISFIGNFCTPVSVGETYVTAEHRGFLTTFKVSVYDDAVNLDDDNPTLVSLSPVQNTYRAKADNGEKKQIRAKAVYADGSWKEIYTEADGVTYSGFDASLITVSDSGVITANGASGSTTVTVFCSGYSFRVDVIIV